LERTSAIKVAIMKSMDDLHHEWKPSCGYHKIEMSKDEWDTKEGTGKSMKYVQRYGKRHLSS